MRIRKVQGQGARQIVMYWLLLLVSLFGILLPLFSPRLCYYFLCSTTSFSSFLVSRWARFIPSWLVFTSLTRGHSHYVTAPCLTSVAKVLQAVTTVNLRPASAMIMYSQDLPGELRARCASPSVIPAHSPLLHHSLSFFLPFLSCSLGLSDGLVSLASLDFISSLIVND